MFESLPGLLANTLICLLIVPQFIRLLKQKNTTYISLPFLLMALGATSVWGVYGWLEQAMFTIVYSALTAMVTFVFMVKFVRHKKGKEGKSVLSALPAMMFNF